MGKRIIAQRKGRGSIYKSSSHKSIAKSALPLTEETTTARVTKFLHNPGRGAPLARLQSQSGETFHVAAVEGMYIGQTVSINESKEVSPGDILPLKKAPPGTLVCHIEMKPGDGGVFARSSGSYAQVIGVSPRGIEIRLPSGQTKVLNPECRAMVGVVSGSGRTEKPFLKAGKKYHRYKAKAGKRYPFVSGVAMNPVDHPYGGGSHQHVGKPKTVARSSPPGKKVGSFAARRTGRRKRR